MERSEKDFNFTVNKEKSQKQGFRVYMCKSV